MKADDVSYALEQTEILYEPHRRISTFGDTHFEFILLTEPMDSINKTRVRTGWIEAERPKIIRPDLYNEVEMEGFSQEGQRFLTWLSEQGILPALLQYGFQFRRSEIQEELLEESLVSVEQRIKEELLHKGDPIRTLVSGVDDCWEICLLKFTVDMIQKSHDINLFDFRRKGLI